MVNLTMREFIVSYLSIRVDFNLMLGAGGWLDSFLIVHILRFPFGRGYISLSLAIFTKDSFSRKGDRYIEDITWCESISMLRYFSAGILDLPERQRSRRSRECRVDPSWKPFGADVWGNQAIIKHLGHSISKAFVNSASASFCWMRSEA